MKLHNFLIPALLLLLFSFSSCGKEGFGGQATLSGSVKHHSLLIPDALVYLKFNAKNSPGTDISKYDFSTAADSVGNYNITGLTKGDYYIYGVGFDPNLGETVTGGIPLKITSDEEDHVTNVPVTESGH